MSESIREGLVGFFDILGYQNLLERNEPELIVEKVLPILTGIRDNCNEEIYTYLPLEKYPKQKAKITPIIAAMEWLVFSDTILLSLPFDCNKGDSSLHYHYWLTFLSAARILQKRLFEAGLPVRGAIDYGKFLIKDSLFAGRCIIKAYQLSNKIEMAACVLSEDAVSNFQLNPAKKNRESVAKAFLVEYLVPTKDGDTRMYVVIARPASATKHSEIHEAVMHAFWGHGKDIPQSVRPKVDNTKQWLEYLEKVKGK